MNTAAQRPNTDQHRRFSLQHVILVALCMFINMLDGFDITAMAVVAVDLASEMSISDDKLGFVFSFSLAGMMLGAMFLAPLSDLYGRRKVILFSLLMLATSVMLTAYVNSLSQLILLRFISGLGAGAMLASLAALVSEYSTQKYTALAVSIVTAGYPLGAMFTGIVAAYIVPEFGWRGMFTAGAGATFLLCLIAYFLLPESLHFLHRRKPRDAERQIESISKRFGLSVSETQQMAEQNQPMSSDDSKPNLLANIKLLLASDYRLKTITLWVCFLFVVCTLYFVLSWLPKLLTNQGFSHAFSRQAFTSLNMGGVIGIFLLGLLAARWSLSVLVAGFLFIAAALMMSYSMTNSSDAAILSIVFMIGLVLQGGFTGLYALAAKLYKPEIRSTGVGWAIGLGRLGAVIGPAIAGFLIAAGYSMEMNFIVFALPLILGGIGIYTLKIR